MNSDDERLGQLLRALRRRQDLTQERLAEVAGITVKELRRIEHGGAGAVRLDRVRAALAPLGARGRVVTWWNGAAADRLLDEEHAEIVEVVARLFDRRAWRTAGEVTFSDYGERGSIDLLAGYEPTLTIAVCEIKSALGSLEETNRMLDVKARLAPKIAERLFGWRPRHVGRLLILPDDSTVRRIIERHAATMNAIYPGRGREVRAWLRRPDASLSAIWFVSNRT